MFGFYRRDYVDSLIQQLEMERLKSESYKQTGADTIGELRKKNETIKRLANTATRYAIMIDKYRTFLNTISPGPKDFERELVKAFVVVDKDGDFVSVHKSHESGEAVANSFRTCYPENSPYKVVPVVTDFAANGNGHV